MKLHGYAGEGKDPQDIISETLAEVTLEATPEELRAMASFLLSAADAMDRMGDLTAICIWRTRCPSSMTLPT